MFTQTKSGLVRNTLAIAVSIFIHTGVPAQAADVAGDAETISRAVSTAGLNLAAPSGQVILRQRIATASHRICRDLMEGESLGSPEFARCLQATEANGWAAAQVRIAAAKASVVASVKP
jgi:UrcA family protein